MSYNKRQTLPFACSKTQHIRVYVSYFGKLYVGLRFNLSAKQIISDRIVSNVFAVLLTIFMANRMDDSFREKL